MLLSPLDSSSSLSARRKAFLLLCLHFHCQLSNPLLSFLILKSHRCDYVFLDPLLSPFITIAAGKTRTCRSTIRLLPGSRTPDLHSSTATFILFDITVLTASWTFLANLSIKACPIEATSSIFPHMSPRNPSEMTFPVQNSCHRLPLPYPLGLYLGYDSNESTISIPFRAALCLPQKAVFCTPCTFPSDKSRPPSVSAPLVLSHL